MYLVKSIFISLILIISISGCGNEVQFPKIFTPNKQKVVVKKEINQDLNVKKLFISDFDKNIKFFNDNTNEIKAEFKSLLNYMNDFHSYIKPLTDNIGNIKAGKFVSSFFVPGAVIELLDVFTEGVDFLNSVDSEIMVYLNATNNKRLSDLMNTFNKFKQNPDNFNNAFEVQKNVITYIFYMKKLQNNLSQLTEVLNSIYKIYHQINEKSKMLSKVLGIKTGKDMLGLKEDIKKIKNIISKNEKLIHTNILLANKIGAIVTGYFSIIIEEEKKKCNQNINSSCLNLSNLYLNIFSNSAGSYANNYRKKYLNISCKMGNKKSCEILRTLKW